MTAYAFPVVGYRKGPIPLHWNISANAADLFAPRGTPIQAMVTGSIHYAGLDTIGGWNVYLIGDPDTKSLHYYMAHMDKKPLVVTGQRVTVGQQLGVVGDSGNALGKGPHCHIGIGLDIKDGQGAEGGAGVPWGNNNCNKYLQHILDTIGSGPVNPDPVPPPPPTKDEVIEMLRILVDDVATDRLNERIEALIKLEAQARNEAQQLINVRNEVIRIRTQALGKRS